jgi:hypothetical protein
MTEYSKQALNAEISQDIRVTAFKILRNVVLATPVDTGRARGNWQVGIDSFKINTVDVTDKSGGVAINAGALELKGVRDYQTVWITNNLPYIAALNDGSSAQAPKKFVETGIRRAIND